MAVIYLSSVDGNDSDDGSTWALAKATLSAAMTAAGNGGTVYMDNAHAEVGGAGMTLAGGTAASPLRILCVDRTGDPEPPTALATTGVVSISGNFAISFTGFAYCYGVTYRIGGTNSQQINWTSNSSWGWELDNCVIDINTSNSGGGINIGTASTSINRVLIMKDTSVRFTHVSQGISCRARLIWNGGSVQSGTVPNHLFESLGGNANGPDANINGVDLSYVSTNLVDMTSTIFGRMLFQNCKVHASATFGAGTVPGNGGLLLTVFNCDSGDTNYNYYYKDYQGEVFEETTIVRTGGASDGTTAVSRKMVTTADPEFFAPLVSDPIIVWNETTGSSVTATVEVVTDNVTLTDAEAWIEVEYLGTSNLPTSLFVNDRAANILTTAANQTSSSETWTTTGLTTPVKQKLSVSFTPQEKGPIIVRVYLAKASTTMYFDPEVNGLGITSGRQYQTGSIYINEGEAGAAAAGGDTYVGIISG